jgi:hypothetical protein
LAGDAYLTGWEGGGDAEVVRHNGGYCLLAPGPGEYELTMRLATPDPADATADQGLRLTPAAATRNRLVISGIPDGASVRIDGLSPAESGPGRAVYDLPGIGGQIQVLVEPVRPVIPSDWVVQSEVLVQYQEGMLHYDGRVYCRADAGSGLSMDLRLPGGAHAVTVVGEDLDDALLGPREESGRPLHIQWNTPDILDRTLQITYQAAQPPLTPQWELAAPRPATPDAGQCLFVIVAVDGLELTGEAINPATQARRVPRWMEERLGAGTFQTAEGEPYCLLQAAWLPRVETAQAMIRVAEFRTRVVEDGALLVEGAYTIEHQSPLTWALDLPAVDELLTCHVNGRPTQPVRRGDTTIEFSLPTPTDGASEIGFSYAGRIAALDPVSGRLALALPRTDLFIHQLQWMLTIPDLFEATAVEGNVAIDTESAAAPERAIRLRKALVRGEQPAAEIYYQRRDLGI